MTTVDTTDERTGSTAAEVDERVANGQSNAFVQASSRSAWGIIRANTLTLFNGIIAACFLVLLLIGRWQDALLRFQRHPECGYRISSGVPRKTVARPAGAPRRTERARLAGDERAGGPIQSVVVDDLLILRAGDQVPADGVVVESTGLQLDESMPTGESDAIDKSQDDEVLSGSIVVAGSGRPREEVRR